MSLVRGYQVHGHHSPTSPEAAGTERLWRDEAVTRHESDLFPRDRLHDVRTFGRVQECFGHLHGLDRD